MIPSGSVDRRSRRRRKKNDHIISFIVFAALVLGLIYLVLRWRDGRNNLENVYAAVALGVAAIAFVLFQSGVQSRIDRWIEDRRDARMRRFWRERTEREHQQHLAQERQDEERRQRRAARREEERLRYSEKSSESGGADP